VHCSARCDSTAACPERPRRPKSAGAPCPRAASAPPRDVALNRRLSTLASTKLVNPIVRRLLERGLMPRTYALLETTGRKSGEPRRTPVGNGLRGDTFWIVAEHGRESNYVKNIEADPRVRVKVGGQWRDGTAHLLPEDDVRARMRELRRPGNDAFVRLAGSSLMTVRIDLDPPEPGPTRA
jgi:deazaflavin-dependent oxidoreductase (nitroreductase family)